MEPQADSNLDRVALLKTLAHDVRTPLTSILGFTQLLLEDETIQGAKREYLLLIEEDAKRLVEMITTGFTQLQKLSGEPDAS